MMKPAMRLPRGVEKEGIIRRIPALETESRRTTWKKRGTKKRNCKRG
jgi:hypothetical protein